MLRVLAMLLATAAPVLAAEGPVCIENATIVDLQKALAAGNVTATDLTRAYIARIEAYDRAGPRLNAVRELNPDALTIAAQHRCGEARAAPSARRHPDSPQGQHRDRRRPAHHRGLARARRCAGAARRVPGQTACATPAR